MKDANDGRKSSRPLTLKQENACLAYVETGNKSEAYRRAFDASNMKDATINKRANEFFDRGDIKGRIAELRAPIYEAHRLTIADLIAELKEAQEMARSSATPQASAHIKATMAKAQLLGYLKADSDEGETAEPVSVNINVTDCRKRAD